MYRERLIKQFIYAVVIILLLVSAGFLGDGNTDFSDKEPNYLRLAAAIQHVMLFLIQTVGFLMIFYPTKFPEFTWSDRMPSSKQLLIGVAVAIGCFPLIAFIYRLNKQIALPEFLSSKEESINSAIENIVSANNLVELGLVVLIVGVLPAISEEFFFRGIFQRLLHAVTKPWIAILIAGTIFSAIHMQFEGFLPRMILGVILGFVFYQTGNIWINVFIHFIFNASQVIGQYFAPETMDNLDIEKGQELPIATVITSAFMLCGLLYIYWKDNNHRNSALPE